MFISKWFASQFRNLNTQELSFDDSLNVFLGQNGQGKTNFLETLALALRLKPLRSIKHTHELIQQSQDEGFIRIHLNQPKLDVISVSLFPHGKKAKLNDKPIHETSTLLHKTALVTFIPDDLQVILGSGSHRRRFLDQITASYFPSYVRLYRDYERALMDRNKLLKDGFYDPALMHSFTEIMIEKGSLVLEHRLETFNYWNPLFHENLREISREMGPITLQYTPSFPMDQSSSIKEAWFDHLKTHHKEERARKTTLAGPHLDDLGFYFSNGLSARQVASRGQTRALTLALQIAHLKMIIKLKDHRPILLLDDVVGELDPLRAQYLFELIETLSIQTFLTTTHRDILPIKIPQAAFFQVHGGKIEAN